MSTNYIETTVTGTKYRRCRAIYINNPVGQPPVVEFIEQDVIITDDDTMTKEKGSIREMVTLDNMNTEFPVVNPDTLEPIPGMTATYAQVIGLMRSAYVYLAKRRDLAQ